MAYIDRFIFRFNSVSGKSVRIVIADDDYTGAAVERRLGGSPQLRCELSGNIRGMSLEIPAECKVDDEFVVLYTSDPTRFAVRVEMDNTVVWRGFVTPELYAAPWVDPPYDVQITATDGLGELKMKEWPAIGSRTLGEILETALGATGLALPVRMISAAATDLSTAANLLTGTTINLDHMAGKSYYDVLDGLLGSLRATIAQRGGAWLLVRETDVTALTSGGQVSDTTGRTYPVKAFGSSRSNDCWPVGRLTTEIVPAKSSVEVECPNKLAALITDPDMELNLWQTNGNWTGEDGGYYTLDLGEYISQTASVANATRDADPGFRIKVSSRNTTPFDVGIMRLTVMTTGRDPRSGSDKTLYLKEVTTQGRTQMEWVAEESHFNDGLGMPKTLDHQDCKEFVTDIFRLPTGFNPIKTITIRVSSGRNTVCVHSVNIECMSVYDKAVTRLLMDNGARGDESYSPIFADSFAGNKGNFLLSNSPKGVTGALVGTWSSEAIPSVPYGEWLAKDMALSVATPRLRMSGRLFTADALPALFYSNKGLSYITEEWDLDLIEDEADISLISLPAAALSTVSVSVIVEDNDGRKGTVSGGEIVSPKTGDSSSDSGYLDWFIAESYEEEGETKYRLKLNPKYEGMYAEGWVSAGDVSDQGGGGGGTGYLRDLLDVNASMSPTQGQALVWDDALGKWTSGDVSVDLTPFERIANRVTTVSSSSNHSQYPTAKAVYDIVNTMLSSAMRFQGVTSTALVDGSTTNPVVVDGASYTATRGDVVVRSDVGLEYLWTGTRWQQLGDESSYAKKTVSITGSGYLTGGGNLEASSQIDIADAVKTKIDNGATAFSYFTDGAANEAIKLRTPRTIWGQPFDGSADVSGAMTGVTSIDSLLNFDTANHGVHFLSGNFTVLDGAETFPSLGALGTGTIGLTTYNGQYGLYAWTNLWTTRSFLQGGWNNGSNTTTSDIVLQPLGGNVGMGTTTPAYRLDVSGDSRTSGKVYIGTSGGYLEVVNVGTTASPVYALKSSLPFFSDSWVSAGGVSSTGSGGGITGYLKDLLDVNGSMIPVDGQALVWDSSLGDNGRWTSKNVSVDLTPFERTINRVTSISASSTDGQYPSARAVYNALSSDNIFRLLAGNSVNSKGLGAIQVAEVSGMPSTYGTILQWSNAPEYSPDYTGSVWYNQLFASTAGNSLYYRNRVNANAWSDWERIAFERDLSGYLPLTGGTMSGSIQIGDYTSFGVSGNTFYLGSPSYPLSIRYNGSAQLNGNTIWHAGNDGSGSGLNADLLDGLHAADFKKQISGDKRVYASGWYRILNCKAYPASFLITFGGGYYDYPPTPVTFLISHSYNATSITQVGRCPYIGAIKKVRVVHHDGYMFYIDVEFEVGQDQNNPISFTVTPLDNCYGGLELIDFSLQSDGGESAIATVRSISVADALNVPRTIWGQPFDGSGNVDGDITVNGKVYIGTSGGYLEVVNVGTESAPEYALHTTLPFYSDSFVSAGGLSGTGGSGSGSSLRDLSDVQLPEIITTGSALVYDGEKWVQSDAAFVPQTRTVNGLELSSDISLSLGDLSNVNTAGASNGLSLMYNDGEWTPGRAARVFFGTCSTGASTTNKIVDCEGFTTADLVAGTIVIVYFTNASDKRWGNATLQVGATNAVNIWNSTGWLTWDAGEAVPFYYCPAGWQIGTTKGYTAAHGYNLPVADANTFGAVRIAYTHGDSESISINSPSTTAGRYYYVESNGLGRLFVNVPWTGGGSGGGGSYSAGTGISITNNTISVIKATTANLGGVLPVAVRSSTPTLITGETASNRYYGVEMNSSGQLFVNVPWTGGSGSASWGTTSKNTSPLTVGGTTKTVMLAGAATARNASPIINTGGTTANRYYGVEISNDGKLFVNVPWLEGGGSTGAYLPIAGGTMEGTINSQSVIAKSNNAYDLGSSGKYYANTYTKKIYLDDGVYIYYDSTNRVIRVQGAGIAATGSVNAGGVSNT